MDAKVATIITDVDIQTYDWPLQRVKALCGADSYIDVRKRDLDHLFEFDMRIQLGEQGDHPVQQRYQLEEIVRSRVRAPWLLGARQTCLILDECPEDWGTTGLHEMLQILSSERAIIEKLGFFGAVKAACIANKNVLEVP